MSCFNKTRQTLLEPTVFFTLEYECCCGLSMNSLFMSTLSQSDSCVSETFDGMYQIFADRPDRHDGFHFLDINSRSL